MCSSTGRARRCYRARGRDTLGKFEVFAELELRIEFSVGGRGGRKSVGCFRLSYGRVSGVFEIYCREVM